jgi:hypothetical protein
MSDISMGGTCSMRGRNKKYTQMMVGELEGKRPRGRLRRRWEDNIRMNLREIVSGVVDWIHLAQDRDNWRDLLTL